MMNLAVGLAESYSESVPVLALIGQPSMALEGKGAFQDSSGIGRSIDAQAMFASMTKHVRKIESADVFWRSLSDAVHAALSGRPGPAVLLLPRDIFELEVGAAPAWLPRTLDSFACVPPPKPKEVQALELALRRARKPVMLLGTGAERSREPTAIRAFARRAGIPVATTMASPNAFPHDHPLFLGIVGAAGHPSAHQYLNDSADLIVAVGTGLDVMARQPLARALKRCSFVTVNVDATEARRVVTEGLFVEGDAGDVFEQLLGRLKEESFPHFERSIPLRTRYRPIPLPALEDGPGPPSHGLSASDTVEVLERYLPERGHLLFDAGNCAVSALHGMSLPSNLSATIALGMGGMGYAIAGAVGAQLGEGRGRTVVVCGDGAFLMLGLEVHTAIDRRLPILFVVFNDSGHGMCVTRQQLLFEGRVECSRYARFNASVVARGLGNDEAVWSARASTRDELIARLEEFDALHAQGPGVLEVVLSRGELPPFGPFLPKDAETEVMQHRTTRLGTVVAND